MKWHEKSSPAAKFRAKAKYKPKKVSDSSADIAKWQRIRRDEMHPVNVEELDRILDKISSEGVASLKADEKEFLERFSAR